MKQPIHLTRSVLFFLAFAISANAGLPEPGKLNIGEVKTKILLDSNIGWNVNGSVNSTNLPTAPQAGYRYNDRGDRQFVLNQAQIGFMHAADPVGFDMAFWFGSQADTSGIVDGAVDRGMTAIRKATIMYKSGSWGLDVGKFDAGVGFESTDSVDNWNYGRSLTYTKILPSYFNGARFNWMSSGTWSFHVIAANGIDRHYDNNRSKTFGGQFNWWNNQGCTVNLSGIWGPENANIGTNPRTTVSLSMKHVNGDKSGYGLNGTYVRGKKDSLNALLSGDATRWAGTLYGMYSFYDSSATTLRYEYVMDGQGAVTLTNQEVKHHGTTLTHRKMVSKNFSVWVEGRYDMADKQIYTDKNGDAEKNQITGTAAFTLNI